MEVRGNKTCEDNAEHPTTTHSYRHWTYATLYSTRNAIVQGAKREFSMVCE